MDLVAKAQTVPKPLKNFEIAGILIEALNSAPAIHQQASRAISGSKTNPGSTNKPLHSPMDQ